MFPDSFNVEPSSDELQFLGDSFCVASAKFKNGTLTIQFQDGSVYEYYNVHIFVWYNLSRVTSKGWFFNKNIRSNYQFTKLS